MDYMYKLKITFMKLAVNPKSLKMLLNKDLVDVYMTQQSIMINFQKVFGYRNETLATRFYNILAEGFKDVRIYLPIFITKLYGLIDGHPLHVNYFGFKLLDSDLKNTIHASDIADIIKNALEFCPESILDRNYPVLSDLVIERSKTDRRCRCALYQEMVALFNTFYEINEKNTTNKVPIDFAIYCQTVKCSVLGAEFRDKILELTTLPKLLGHANQPTPGQSMPKQTAMTAYSEICSFLQNYNSKRKNMTALIERELSNATILQRRCSDIIQQQTDREQEILG